ncbi:predicted protein [Plenodomus lingam JN3]|uniref:Uncharacterized protein n=2 Tax=Leptosphaeria maculans TaxID=5022 RepID=E5A6E5_LEPMJ|nr:predicted protein [Plenodomus lingam JN3]CBX99190.1 predicted protein [Plenodomus lingam JN3]
MDARSTVLVPFGISNAQYNSRTGNKNLPIPFGLRMQQRICTLKELTQLSFTTPTIKRLHVYPPNEKSLAHHKRDPRDTEREQMGAVKDTRRSKVRPATGKEKRDRRSKITPMPYTPTRKKNTQPIESSRQSSKAKKTHEIGKPMGASQDMPIPVPSDDESAPARNLDDNTSIYNPSSSPATTSNSSPLSDLDRFLCEVREPAPPQSRQCIYPPFGSRHPPFFILRRSDSAPNSQLPTVASRKHTSVRRASAASTSSVAHPGTKHGSEQGVAEKKIEKTANNNASALRKPAKRHRYRNEPSPNEPLISASKVRSSDLSCDTLRRIDHRCPDITQPINPLSLLSPNGAVPSAPYRSSPNVEPNLSRSQLAAPKNPGLPSQDWFIEADNAQCKPELTLAGITGFDTRSKVAQLMAVAPAFSVQELYDLLKDCKGRYTHAKARALRPSDARSPALPRSISEADGDELKVKIDPNDSFLEWDLDEPEGARPALKSSKSRSQMHRNEYTPNPPLRLSSSSRSRPAKPAKPARPAKSAKSAKSASRHTMHVTPHKGTITKKPGSSLKPASQMRKTSPDRDFVVPDSDGPDTIQPSCSYTASENSGDTSSSSSSSSESGNEPVAYQDPMDLDIDMQPRYAFNAELLFLRKKGLGAFI